MKKLGGRIYISKDIYISSAEVDGLVIAGEYGEDEDDAVMVVNYNVFSIDVLALVLDIAMRVAPKEVINELFNEAV